MPISSFLIDAYFFWSIDFIFLFCWKQKFARLFLSANHYSEKEINLADEWIFFYIFFYSILGK